MPRYTIIISRKYLYKAGHYIVIDINDFFRSKDTEALIEAVESGQVEVNFMDDVGQTLLNWASAFGTQEMVEYLCNKGADVNKGMIDMNQQT